MDHFLPFYPPNSPKIKIFKKWKKRHLEVSFYTSVLNIMIIWYTVLEILHVTNVNAAFHFGLFFCRFTLLTTRKIKILKKWKTDLEISSFYIIVPKTMIICYTFPEMVHGRCNCYFSFWFWINFCPFTTITAQKIKNFINMEKMPGDTIILHKCTINHDHRLYCSWGMTCNRCNCYFSFWAIFCSFTSLTAQKIKIKKKKWKKHLQISSLYKCVPKIMIR